MKYVNLVAASLFVATMTHAAALAASYPHTLQKQCSIEFQQKPKETRGGFAGWQEWRKECSKSHKDAGNTFAKRGKK